MVYYVPIRFKGIVIVGSYQCLLSCTSFLPGIGAVLQHLDPTSAFITLDFPVYLGIRHFLSLSLISFLFLQNR